MANVSIFVSYYNGIKYLPTFLENFHEQTMFKELEMVFVGCLLSTEERNILNSFKEKYPKNIKIIEYDTLVPQSVCWNRSVLEASAEVVCEWNVDDIRTNNSIQKQYEILVSNPEIDVSSGNFIVSKKHKDFTGEYVECRYVWTMKEWKTGMILGPFFMFRKKVCEEIGYFDEGLKSGADYDFSVRLLAKHKFALTNYLLGYFLDEGAGLSTGCNKLQPVERTVIEMRYGFKILEPQFIEMAKKYNVDNILQPGNKLISVKELYK